MNLLPTTEKEILRNGFKRRFVIVADALLALSFVAGTVMLLPTYFLTKGNLALITSINSSAKAEDEESTKQILELPKEIDAKLKFFQTNATSKTSVGSLTDVISYLPEKVKLNSISLNRNQSEKEKRGTNVIISGVASSREALVSFGNALKGSKFFATVDVPVSSLAKEKDLPFSINIFIAD